MHRINGKGKPCIFGYDIEGNVGIEGVGQFLCLPGNDVI